MACKQVIVVRTDLGMEKGKISAQVAHASLCAYKKAGRKAVNEWEMEGSKKVVLKISGEMELMRIFEHAKMKKLPACLITDAGKTQLSGPARTCVGIGPAEEKEIDSITRGLKLL